LPARSQFASGRSCDRPTRSRFSVVFLGSRANAELVPKFHIAIHVSHAALPLVTLKISPYTNVTLTFDFGFGRRRSNCQTKKLKSGWGPGTKTNCRSITWNWTCVIALQITDPSSHQRGRPAWKNTEKVIVSQRN
jgi:hypothetical protein